MPFYYKKISQNYPVCKPKGTNIGIKFRHTLNDPSGVLINRAYRKGTPAGTNIIDGSNNLTKSQKYTISELMNARKAVSQDRYFAPVISNVLYRFPITNNILNIGNGVANAPPLIIKNDLNHGTRRYFGPVTIKTLKVRLVNDKGLSLDLNNMDFSFSLMIERLYQY